jgi:cell division protease FtsH
VTIIPRGRALGLTQQLPEDDRHTYSKDYLSDSIAILMGGRVAEELVFNQLTTGASNDIDRATHLARRMVCEWGMSKELGPLSFGRKDEQVFLGRDIVQHRDYSEHTAITIDQEVRGMVEENYQRAKTILTEHLDLLNRVAEMLLEKETLDLKDLDRIIAEVKPELLARIQKQKGRMPEEAKGETEVMP